ncbi:13891_t:CDS:1, partial [Entrophospora sp. SA101]
INDETSLYTHHTPPSLTSSPLPYQEYKLVNDDDKENKKTSLVITSS